jgi:hypothetical protein
MTSGEFISTVPAAPTATAGHGEVKVAVAPGSGSGDAATRYTVTASAGCEIYRAPSGLVACVATGLSNGTAYTFTATTSYNSGTFDQSPASAAVTPTTRILGAVTKAKKQKSRRLKP